MRPVSPLHFQVSADVTVRVYGSQVVRQSHPAKACSTGRLAAITLFVEGGTALHAKDGSRMGQNNFKAPVDQRTSLSSYPSAKWIFQRWPRQRGAIVTVESPRVVGVSVAACSLHPLEDMRAKWVTTTGSHPDLATASQGQRLSASIECGSVLIAGPEFVQRRMTTGCSISWHSGSKPCPRAAAMREA